MPLPLPRVPLRGRVRPRLDSLDADVDCEDWDSFASAWSGSPEDLPEFPACRPFLRGDADGNGAVRALSDGLFVLDWAFRGSEAPPCLSAADVNGDGSLHPLVDPIYLLTWAFQGGDAPPEPGPYTCGVDTVETLGCETISETCQ